MPACGGALWPLLEEAVAEADAVRVTSSVMVAVTVAMISSQVQRRERRCRWRVLKLGGGAPTPFIKLTVAQSLDTVEVWRTRTRRYAWL